MMHRVGIFLLGALLVLWAALPAGATSATLDPISRGCWVSLSSGSPGCDNSGANTGEIELGLEFLFGFGAWERRGFLIYDLGTVAQPISSAHLEFAPRAGTYASGDPSETLGLFAVAADPATIVSTTVKGGGPIFDDLGSGTLLGSVTLTPGDFGSPLSVPLPAATVAALDAAAGGTFAFGLALTSIPPPSFGVVQTLELASSPGSGGTPTPSRLVLQFVPEPASCVLLALGGAGLALRRPGSSSRAFRSPKRRG